MTISLPQYRNSFHPAWLLLFVPAALQLAVSAHEGDGRHLWHSLLSLLPVLLLLGPLVWFRLDEPISFVRRWLKELRAQMPGCLIAMLIPGLLAPAGQSEVVPWMVFAYGLGGLLMGAAAFGNEFEQRTMAGYLGQPRSRGALYLEKLAPLGFLLTLATGNLGLILLRDDGFHVTVGEAAGGLLIPLFIFCTAPLFSLLTRSTLAGLIFTVAMPLLLLLLTMLGYGLVYRVVTGEPAPPSPPGLDWLTYLGTGGYLLLGAWASWASFHRLEVREGGVAQAAGGMHPLSLPVDRLLGRLLPDGPTGRLIRKELRLHVLPWLISGMMVGLWLLWLVVRAFAGEETRRALSDPQILFVLSGMLAAICLVGTGAAAVAEERQLGTLEWQLTQPATLRRQWLVKVLVAAGLSLLLGVLLPVFLLVVGLGWEGFVAGLDVRQYPMVAWLVIGTAVVGAVAGALTIALHASSLCRSTMKAAAVAVGHGAALAGMVVVTGQLMLLHFDARMDEIQRSEGALDGVPAWLPSLGATQLVAAGLVASGWLVVLIVLHWLAGRNLRQVALPAATIVRQLGGIALLTWSLAVVVLLLIGQLAVWQAKLLMQQERSRQALQPGPQAPQGSLGMSPELALRYGLSAETNRAALSPAAPARTPPNPYTMDPELARRYGLVPAKQPGGAGEPR